MYPKLIGLTGYKGSGKDETAKAIIGQMGPYKRIAFATPIREICKIVFGLTDEEMSDRVLKEKPLNRYPFESPRRIMQQIGTDMFRSVWEDVWIEATKRIILQQKDTYFCVTDMRFPNERHALTALGGITVRVNRTDQPENLDPHPSERYIGQLTVDHEISAKTGEIDSLHSQIRLITGLHQDQCPYCKGTNCHKMSCETRRNW